MFKFSFIKKSNDNERLPKLAEKVEFITSYSNQSKQEINEVDIPTQQKSNKLHRSKNRFRVQPFTNYSVTEPMPACSLISSEEMAASIVGQIKEQDKLPKLNDSICLLKEKLSDPNAIKRKPQKYQILKRKKNSHNDSPLKPIVVNGYALVMFGKHKNRFGKVTSLSEDQHSVRIFLHDRDIIFPTSKVKAISESEYNALVGSIPNKIHKPNEQSPNLWSSQPWMFPDLCVRIIDDSYQNGEFRNQTVRIEDIYGSDECLCVSQSNQMLYKLKSHMLAPVPPTQNKRARVIGGKHSSEIVTVMQIDSSQAEVLNEETEEEFEVDLHHLCSLDF